jgi:5-methyltetrahydropteroyltriglutamate--homocysteine methyltransferase
MIYKDISEQNFLERANKHVEVLNKSLENIDPSKVRMHICWGNYEGPHTHDIGLNKIIEIAFKAKINKYLIESANPRHAHEWEVFENIKLPKDKIIIPGVIESTSNFIEHPDVVKHRILVFSKVIDPSQLMAGTDCGFGTFAGFGNVDENIAYKKLESLVIGSRLASKVI